MLHVHLNGSKLKGEWLLRRDPDRGEQAWALSKVGKALRRMAREREDASALSRRTMAEIAAAKDAEWRSGRALTKRGAEQAAKRRSATREQKVVDTGASSPKRRGASTSPDGAAAPGSNAA